MEFYSCEIPTRSTWCGTSLILVIFLIGVATERRTVSTPGEVYFVYLRWNDGGNAKETKIQSVLTSRREPWPHPNVHVPKLCLCFRCLSNTDVCHQSHHRCVTVGYGRTSFLWKNCDVYEKLDLRVDWQLTSPYDPHWHISDNWLPPWHW